MPEFEYDDTEDELPDGDRVPELCALSWTVYSLPGDSGARSPDLGEAEYALRSAVRSAAEALGALRLGSAGGVDDPRGLVEQVLESQHGNTARPIMRRRGRCACWRTPHTSTRSSRSVPD